MFHLQSSIDLDEEVLARLVHQELDCSGVLVADLLRQVDSIAGHRVADFHWKIRSWSNFHHLNRVIDTSCTLQ